MFPATCRRAYFPTPPTNLYEFDTAGNAIKIKEPIIHSLNKHEILIRNFPVFEEIKERPNILLLGDGLEDIGMAEGFEYKEIIKVGFLNQDVENSLPVYSENFDIVITNDGSLEFVNEMLIEMMD